MELNAPDTMLRWKNAPRVIPSRCPSVGLLDFVAAPADLDAVFELEGWTNDRISVELGILRAIPPADWVIGRPMASVVMAAYCHPRTGGSRFSSGERGAWYAARAVETALAESAYHRTQELREVGAFDTRVEMRVYLADLSGRFADIRGGARRWAPLLDPRQYGRSQEFGTSLLEQGANGVVHPSVCHAGGECVACFRPRLVRNVRMGGHIEFRWQGTPQPIMRRL